MMERIIIQVNDIFTVFGLKALSAAAILFIGWQAAKFLKNLIKSVMEKAKVDPTLISFSASLTYVGLMTFIVLSALSQIGVQTTSFIAVIGAAGLAVGMALQGSLANFAAGVLIIIFRPFKVGDFIQGAGVTGVIEEIQIFTTILKTPDNKNIFAPNAKLTGDNVTNFSANNNRRLDIELTITCKDIDKVKEIIKDVLNKDNRVLKDPAPLIRVIEFTAADAKFVVRPWAKTTEYWDVYFDTVENIKRSLVVADF